MLDLIIKIWEKFEDLAFLFLWPAHKDGPEAEFAALNFEKHGEAEVLSDLVLFP